MAATGAGRRAALTGSPDWSNHPTMHRLARPCGIALLSMITGDGLLLVGLERDLHRLILSRPAADLSEHAGMKRLWTIIGVRDVAHSFRWYQALLGLAPGEPAHSYFGQLIDADGTVLLCVHEWGVEDHPTITSPDAATPGNGLILFFRVDDFDAALARARTAGASLEDEPHVNPNTRMMEFSLRDPDGYHVMISAS